MRLLLSILALVMLVGAGPGDAPAPGLIRVRLVTTFGPIVLALDAHHAPQTTANFLAYVDDQRLDGTHFYRAARRKTDPKFGFIQGGTQTDARRVLPTFPFESTAKTGLHHLDATISMAHGTSLKSAGGNFVLTVGAVPSMDAKPGYLGYAAFGHVVAGMDVVRRILAMPTGGGYDAMKDQMLFDPVKLIRAERLDGVAKPTGRPRPWLLFAR